jgi:hypothetical protein
MAAAEPDPLRAAGPAGGPGPGIPTDGRRGPPPTPLRVTIFLALVLSAAVAFFVQPRVIAAVRAEELAAAWIVAAPAVFSLVVAIAALDAWRVARRRGYFRGPSLVAIAASVAFLGLLLPNTVSEYRARTTPPLDAAALHERLLQSRDPRVRALVMEVAGLKPGSSDEPAALLARGLVDPDPLVVRTAVAAVEHRAGVPLEGPDAVARAQEIVKTWQAGR